LIAGFKLSIPNSCPLQYALAYAELGWLVFPVHSIRDGKCTCDGRKKCNPGKHPRTRHGFKDATKDPGRIRRWWREYPDANVAIATGAESRIFVLDVDPRHGGDATFNELVKRLGPLPDTIVAATGSGGRHYVFAHAGGSVKTCQGIALGIDIKGDGGYIVVAPSNHESGGRYAWRASLDPWSAKAATLPNTWLDWLRSGGVVCTSGAAEARLKTAAAKMPLVKQTVRAANAKAQEDTSGEYTSINGARYREVQAHAPKRPADAQGFSEGRALKPSPILSLDELTDDERRALKRAISQNLPRAPGERNQKSLFGFARAIAGIPRLRDAPESVKRAILREYYDAASPRTSAEHSFEDYWDELTYALPRVRFPGDVNMIEIIETVAGCPPHPVCAAKNCVEPRRVCLLGLCAELQKLQGEAPFFLSCEMAAKLLKHIGHSAERMQVHRMLHGFVRDGLLKIERNGDRYNATRWRFIWKPADVEAYT
jgi:Bifunctional DNA primase/polymerase, N-terminal